VARTACALLLLGALVLAGCATKLDSGKIEASIKKGLTDRTGTKIASVDCPGDVEAKKGDTFRCTAKAVSGERVPIEVIQQDGKGRIVWRVVQAGR